MPRAALRKGSSIDNVDCAWSQISKQFEMCAGLDFD